MNKHRMPTHPTDATHTRRVYAVVGVAAALVVWIAVALSMSLPAHAAESLPACDPATTHAYHPENGVVIARTDEGECTAYLVTYELPKTWDGEGWNATASPQHLLYSIPVTVTTESQTFPAKIPSTGTCAVQVDLVPEQPPETITYPEGIGQTLLDAQHFYVEDCGPTPTPTTSSPTPTEPTHTAPPPTHTAPTPTHTIPAPPNPCDEAGACLPDTGSSNTVLLALIGVVLLGSGAFLLRRMGT